MRSSFGGLVLIMLITVIHGCSKEEPEVIVEEAKSAIREDGFSEMRPAEGTVLVPPRIGLGWRYRKLPEEVASLYRVQVLDEFGATYVRVITESTYVRVTLPPEVPPGTYTWWVERIAQRDSIPHDRSGQVRFELR